MGTTVVLFCNVGFVLLFGGFSCCCCFVLFLTDSLLHQTVLRKWQPQPEESALHVYRGQKDTMNTRCSGDSEKKNWR